MVCDLKTYKDFISSAVKPTETQISQATPFLIAKVGSDYIYSKLQIDSLEEQSISKRTFEFCFNYNNLKIKESFVYRIEFFHHDYDSYYRRIELNSGVILTSEELKDFVLVIYKYRDNQNCINKSCDISIYDNFGKFCELENVKSLIINEELDKSRIFYYRRFNNDYRCCSYDERWIFMNGQEYSENSLKLSLSEWNDLFKPHSNSFWDIKHLFSGKNEESFFSKNIAWNAHTSYKWECPLGHFWMAPVKDLTAKTIYGNYCPVCGELILRFDYKSDEKQAKMTYNKVLIAQSEFKTKNIESVINSLEEEIAELQEMRDMGILWFDHAKMPDSVIFYFAYPNGKHGDIDKVICETYGEITQIDEFLFRAVLPTNYYKEIELLSESYSNKKLLKGVENEELTSFLSKHNVMHRLTFLSSLAHVFRMPTRRYTSIDREMTQYRAPLRVKRTEIYNKLVGENKSTRKWTSEQLLYHLVKSVFSDAVFQYKTKWLGNQSLDIFVPSINLGIEYQGKQHYEPVKLFGGEEQFKERLILDEKKRTLCKDNGITLIEWKYNTEISELNLKIILKNWL